jgi:hypothetical protein
MLLEFGALDNTEPIQETANGALLPIYNVNSATLDFPAAQTVNMIELSSVIRITTPHG